MPFSVWAIMSMASATAVSGPPATPADVDARLQLLATAINQQQLGNADGKITSAEAGHLSITLHLAASGEIPLGSDAEAQPVASKMICAVPMFRRMVDRYGITFHIVFSAPNWPTPINAKVVASDCGNPASDAGHPSATAVIPPKPPYPAGLATQAASKPIAETTGVSTPPQNILVKVVANLSRSMKDPQSMRDLHLCPAERSAEGEWQVSFSLNAKNSYGAYAGQTYFMAFFDKDEIDHISSPDLGPEANGYLLSDTAKCALVANVKLQGLIRTHGWSQ